MSVVSQEGPKAVRQSPSGSDEEAQKGTDAAPLRKTGSQGSRTLGGVGWYFSRWKGQGGEAPSMPPWHFMLLSFVGSYAGILAVTACHKFFYHFAHINLLIPSFGASAVILFCSPDSPLGTPRAFVGGQVLSAVVGCAMRNAVKQHPWLAAPLAVCLAVFVMELTGTVHPPGGATAFIASMETPERPVAEFQIVVAVLLDCLAMLTVALVVMNIHPKSPTYPKYWLGIKQKSGGEK